MQNLQWLKQTTYISTTFYFVSVLFLTAHPDVTPELLESLKLVNSGAAPLGALDEERLLERVSKSTIVQQGKILLQHLLLRICYTYLHFLT